MQVENIDHVVVALGSGGTMAGLVHGLGADLVYGVHTGAVSDPEHRVVELLSAMQNIPYEQKLRIRMDQVGDGYSTLTDAVKEALKLIAHYEGIVLDPIYTGRAFAGLIAAVRDGTIKKGQRTIFMHTGGLPGFFGHPDMVQYASALTRI